MIITIAVLCMPVIKSDWRLTFALRMPMSERAGVSVSMSTRLRLNARVCRCEAVAVE